MLDLFAAAQAAPAPCAQNIVAFDTVYCEPAAAASRRGGEILARYPGAKVIEVAAHDAIPALRQGDVADWMKTKRQVLVLGVKKTMTVRPNGRSADFIAPSTSNGCAMACTYCYVARHKGHSNPVTVFTNVEDAARTIVGHLSRTGPKPGPNQVDPVDWVYDLGENGDLSVDALISDNVLDLVTLFRRLPGAKASFATKYADRGMLSYDPRGRTRVRMSLMPEAQARLLDVRTSPVTQRIAHMNELHRAGYEVHVNFSPVVIRNGWIREWDELFAEMDAVLCADVKRSLAAEVIMLTHNAGLHEVNMAWHPKGEGLLWRPDLQEAKTSQNGMENIRYRTGQKADYVRTLTASWRCACPTAGCATPSRPAHIRPRGQLQARPLAASQEWS